MIIVVLKLVEIHWVNEDNIWMRVHQSIKANKICQETKLYNIITHNGLIIAEVRKKIIFSEILMKLMIRMLMKK